MSRRLPVLALVGPGLLTAATGVGAGDLATSGIAGSRLGTAILWAVALGAFIKYLLSEGLARWQLVTGETILEGAIRRLGPVVAILFVIYFIPWSYFTGAALISACGLTAAAMVPGAMDDPAAARLALGAAHAMVGLALVWLGGYRLIERLMAACVGIMFVAVILTAVRLGPDAGEIARGLVVPRIPQASEGGLTWTIALMGGVGGTLTIICYGYWIRAEGREDPSAIRTCRVDLAVGYGLTALFGMALVVIASGMTLDGSGANLIVALADRLESSLGATARWIFLVGAWAAVFSSLLGVLQAVPYVFADFLRIIRRGAVGQAVNERGLPYRAFLVALATVPILQITRPFSEVQKYYAVIGAAFVPLLAIVLLILLGNRTWMGRRHVNRLGTDVVLGIAIILSLLAAVMEIRARL